VDLPNLASHDPARDATYDLNTNHIHDGFEQKGLKQVVASSSPRLSSTWKAEQLQWELFRRRGGEGIYYFE